MITVKETREKIANDQKWWAIHLMNFVDDFRRSRDLQAIEAPFRHSESFALPHAKDFCAGEFSQSSLDDGHITNRNL
jgi:hypothetical protein